MLALADSLDADAPFSVVEGHVDDIRDRGGYSSSQEVLALTAVYIADYDDSRAADNPLLLQHMIGRANASDARAMILALAALHDLTVTIGPTG